MTIELGESVGAGREAQVFRYGENDVIKLLREEAGPERLQHEAAAQGAAREAGLRVPAVRGVVVLGGHPGLVMERVDGVDGLTAAERAPWRIWAIGVGLGKLHRGLGGVPAPEGLHTLKQRIEYDLAHSSLVPAAALPRVRALLETLPDGEALCHQDFHPGNVIESSAGPTLIDFANVCAGDPIADHVKSLILFEAGAPLDPGFKQRLILKAGRDLMRMAYVRGYGAAGRIPADRVRRWKPVLVAQRLAHNIPEERQQLLRMLSRSLREAGA